MTGYYFFNMTSYLPLLVLLLSFSLEANCQCVVSKDQYGQVVTTCEVYKSASNTEPSHKQEAYLGSPYLTYPAWQKGKVRIEAGGKEIACELAYDVVANEVLCRFDDKPAIVRLAPYSFTLDGLEYTRQLSKLPGLFSKRYTTVLYEGPTRLTKSISRRLVPTLTTNGYDKSSYFYGYYQSQETYYLQQGEALPEVTQLDQASLLSLLPRPASPIAVNSPTKQLAAQAAIRLLMAYDSVMALSNRDKPPLSTDAVFNQLLRKELSYPNQAWLAGVYGRVYVGFTVDAQGQLSDLVTLSPANVGYGLDGAVKQALRQSVLLKPAYQGTYVLPVSFTFDHTQDDRGAYIPVNVLSPDRYVDRVLLTEHVVPIRVAKPGPQIREVWGYYK
ncbi:energy transducer TonB [Fibrella arboris]|uniref:energy transducer TonB n=1 Tax=Fibrella arboris TaxID=3242486 RepID=UPI0035217AC6